MKNFTVKKLYYLYVLFFFIQIVFLYKLIILNQGNRFIYVCIFLIFSFLVAYLSKILFNLIKELTNKSLDIEKFKYIEDEIVYYRKHRHDMKNHLAIMYELARNSKIEELKEYSNSYIKKTDSSLHTVDSGIQELDILLYQKIDIGRENDIDLQFYSNCILNVDNKRLVDFISIFSNLIDNALEACLDVENIEERSINISIDKDPVDYTLVVTNTFNNKQDIEKSKLFTSGYSTKSNPQRGLGLGIVKSISYKLKGHVSIEVFNDKFFQVKVEIPIVSLR